RNSDVELNITALVISVVLPARIRIIFSPAISLITNPVFNLILKFFLKLAKKGNLAKKVTLPRFLGDLRISDFISNFEHGLMAHELAHSWFGNYITCGSWQHIWLNEGFATYLTGLTYQYMFNGYWWNTWKHMTIQHVLSQPDGSVFCYDTTNVSRIFDGRLSYNKGSLILHMLRWVIGDLAFFIGIKNYLNDTNLAYSYAYSDDFIQHMELAADTSLYDFFNAWLYGEGYPIYEIKCDIISNTKMKLSVHQYTSHPSVSVYKMPLPIQFKSQDKDTIIVFNNYLNYQEWFIDLGFVPDTIIFDPYMWLLAKVNSIIINDYRENVNGLNVVPNPVSDYFTIWHTDAIINDISLINLLGQQLVLLNNVEIIPYDKVNISVKQLNKGLWILKVKTVNGIILKKIIKL
ncbi:MAG TPA: M1 family aminopeptidase, partial [Bacteroidales bacterium]|nr:M1 family aminopeptidase [Bacteroidales bacterium]